MASVVSCIELNDNNEDESKRIQVSIYAQIDYCYIHIGKECYRRSQSELMDYIIVGLKEDLQRIDEANTQIIE